MDEQTVGGVTMQTVERACMRLIVRGELSTAEVGAIVSYASSCRAKLGEGEGLGCVVIARDMVGIERQARTALTKERGPKIWDRVAVVGAPFDVEVTIELLIRSLQSMAEDTAELCFHDSEVVARAWLGR